jgi:hypothetical protein
MADLPPIRLMERKAGAAYEGHPCEGCRRKINPGALLIVEEHMGVYTGRFRPFHRNCHPTIVEKVIAKILCDYHRDNAERAW